MGCGPAIAVDIPAFDVHRCVGLPGHDHFIPTLFQARLEVPCVLEHKHRLFHGRDAALEKTRKTAVLATVPRIETDDRSSHECGWKCDRRLDHRFQLRRNRSDLRRWHSLRRRFYLGSRGWFLDTAEEPATREREY